MEEQSIVPIGMKEQYKIKNTSAKRIFFDCEAGVGDSTNFVFIVILTNT